MLSYWPPRRIDVVSGQSGVRKITQGTEGTSGTDGTEDLEFLPHPLSPLSRLFLLSHSIFLIPLWPGLGVARVLFGRNLEVVGEGRTLVVQARFASVLVDPIGMHRASGPTPLLTELRLG
ncbi:hypothetical protein A2304_00525 [Candidatus Uhrbacteria bacterium RIFOXYB2_FULL_57_15]|uniref:Uncharacterized protein n=1 Tax=Candidatus Uhrbacteria bacterium RIFOXYB2_FULL_57_15 TaxID=1802422 RepID=A0A1F7W4J7_9BACT|nr:MAG: hypothetical protein A2304_00525 [Candidatus Uhrbacteria bacterium RIFOXYB2_FULL_57_15]